jgi:endoglucanase
MHFVKIPAMLLACCLQLAVFAQNPGAVAPLVLNSGFETDADNDGWPDHWAGVKAGGSWEEENGNHFLRLLSPEPGSTTMLYQEIGIPEGTGAIRMTWKQRVTGLVKGKNSWFDARIMMEFMDGAREKVSPSPPTPNTGKDTSGWVEKELAFLVPEKARILKFMPSLLQVEAGTFDLDDLLLQPTDPLPLVQAKDQEKQDILAKKHASAQKLLDGQGSLMPGWNHEGRWAKKKGILEEGGNHFLRLHVTEPGKMAMDYRLVELPAGAKALELKWKQRITGLKKGEKPWYDARIMMEWKDAWGAKMKTQPPAPYSGKDTDGWVEKSTRFLVPEEAATLVFMPTLFNVRAGTFDLDDFVLRAIAPEELLLAKADRERRLKERHVPDETPVYANWPQMLHTQGNLILDISGKEVWLQGVNAGGLETLPDAAQVTKSVVVAIDEWRANCIRLPIVETLWWGESAYQEDGGQGYRQGIRKIVTLAANRGAYVIIDLHRYRAPKAEHVRFWKEVAKEYNGHPAVLFDILNEPHGINWETWQKGGKVGDGDKAFDSPGMQGLVDAVRSTGAKNIIVAGGTFYCANLGGVLEGYALDDKGGNGIIYSWHNYHWHKGWEEKLKVLEKYPVLLGEVGADVQKMSFIPAENQEDPATWVPDMLGFIQKHKFHWTGWCFHTSANPRMLQDWDYTPTPFWGQPAKDALAGKIFPLGKVR